MSSLTSTLQPTTSSTCKILPGEGSQVQPKPPLLQILRVAGALQDVFTLKEVMHYLGQYIMGKQLYDKQRQHIVHCQDDPLGELLEVESFSVKSPSPVYAMLKKYLVVANCADAAETLSVGRECVDGGVEDGGQVGGGVAKAGQEVVVDRPPPVPAPSQRRPRDPDGDSLDGPPRSACKRPKLDVTLDEWDLSGLPWWFLGNLRSNYSRRSNGSTDIHTNQLSPVAQEEDTAIVSDTTDDLWFLTEGGSEQVSVEMREAASPEGGGGGETRDALPDEEEEEEATGEEERADKEMQEELEEESQCLSDDTDIEISTQDAWQCTECRKFNSPPQRYCMRCWALRKDWYKDVPRLAHSLSVPDIPGCSSRGTHEEEEEEEDSDAGVDVPDCTRTVSDPVILPSHATAERPLPTVVAGKGKGPLPRGPPRERAPPGAGGQESPGTEAAGRRPDALLEPCKLCRVRPRNGNIVHGRTAHLLTCFPCAKRLRKFRAPCPGCGLIIQRVIKVFVV